jgi:hypothetical protein
MFTTTTTTGRLIATLALAIATAIALPAQAQEPPRSDGSVVLALDEYRALRARAFPAAPDPLPPPVDATLTRIDYELAVNGDTVTGVARLTIDVLKQGWVSIPLPTGLFVRGARLDGKPTALVDGNPPRVLVSRAGRVVLSLDIVMPVESSGGIEALTLPASASALSAVTLIVPRTGLDLTVSGGFVAEQTEGTAENRWLVYGTPSRPIRFSWKRRVDDRRASLPLRTRARLTQLVAIGEDTSLITASLALEVVQGAAREVVLAVPEGIAINQVSGSSVADWKHEGGALTVTFLEPVLAATSIAVGAESRAARVGPVAIPLLRVPAAERESGGVAVDVVGAGEITNRQPRGLDPADPGDLGGVVAGRESPSMVAFEFKPLAGTAPRSLTVDVSRYTPQAVLVANVEEARYETLAAEDGKILVRARYAVRNNQRAFLAVKLPEGAVLWSAALAGRPVRPGLAAGGGYLLPLLKGRAGETAPTFAVELVYLQRGAPWSDKGVARIELPAVDLPVSRTGLVVNHSPRFAVEAQPGAFRVEPERAPWSPELQGDVAAGLPTAPPPVANMPDSVKTTITADSAQSLVDRFRKDTGRTTAGTMPVKITIPELGPSFFVAAELTAESHAAVLDLNYKRVSER